MEFLLNFYAQNKDAIQLFAAAAVYIVTHRQTVLAYAKRKASQLIIAAEKGSEQLLLNSGAEKMDWVVEKAYNDLPAACRLVISPDKFRDLAQKVFDDAIKVVAVDKQQDPVVAAPKAPVEGGTTNG